MHEMRLQVGPAAFRLLSQWRTPIDQLRTLYVGYPVPDIADFTVRLEASSAWRRYIRPSVAIEGDFMLPDAAPLPLAQGLLAAEMGMNLQMALGWRRHLLLHASAVEKDGRAIVMTGESGSGKSTLAAMLGERGWRFMGDEFVLLNMTDGSIAPFPRLISLKNEAIARIEDMVPADRLGPRMDNTPKGSIRHVVPNPSALARMDETARPALLLFPRFGHATQWREVPLSERFMRLTQASTNYVALGEPGYEALGRFVADVPALAFDYPDGETAFCEVDRLWKTMA